MRDDAEAMRQSRRSDPQVVTTERLTARFQVRPDTRMGPCDGLRDGDRLEQTDHVLDEREAAVASGSGRPIDAM
jgi:hypothetical protein